MASEAQMNQLQSLYIAYFGRPADAAGVTYWTPIIDGGTSFDEIAGRFMDSDEFTATSSDLNDVVTAAYANGLGREAGADEVAFWVGQIEAGNETVASLLEAFRSTDDATDRQTLENKILVANAYTAAAEAGAEFDTAASVALLAGVDSTQASVDAALEEIGEVPAEGLAGELAAYEAAVEALDDAAATYSNALVEADVIADTDSNDDGIADAFVPATNDYVLQAEAAELQARTDLSAERLTLSDAALQTALNNAQTAVNEDTGSYNADGTAYDAVVGGPAYTAVQLQARAVAAQNTLNANIAAGVETDELAQQIEDAIALYNTSATPNAALVALAGDVDALQAAAPGVYDAALVDFYQEVQTAFDAVFAGTDGASVLEAGARGDAIEALLTTLNVRADLAEAAASAQAGFEATAVGSGYAAAAADLQERQDYIDAVAEAQEALVAITAAASAYEEAQSAVAEAADALGYDIQDIDAAVEFGTAEADLFIFDAEALSGTNVVVINGLSSEDVVFLGSAYALGTAGSADNNVFEVFVSESNGNAVLQVENTAFGSNNGVNGDFTTITLTGVAAADVTVDNGVVSFA